MKLSQLVARVFIGGAMPRWILWGMAVCLAIGLLSFQVPTQPWIETEEAAMSLASESDEPIQPIEALSDLDQRKIELGRSLFQDPQLSHNNQVSCASCHLLLSGGADRRAHSIGINGSVGKINAPTVLNSGFNFRQSWDGRAETLEKQIDDPIQSKVGMGSSWPEVIGKLRNSTQYAQAFRKIYGGDIQVDRVKNVIAEFERSLSTPNSRFDRYLRHETDVLTGGERKGYALFKSFGCATCHQGMNIGGNMFQKVGVMGSYFDDRGSITRADRGRFNVTGDPRELYVFRVPSLRNVALTPPYLHDGSAATLEDAVRIMAKYQLAHPLTAQDIGFIVEFLRTLTGELNGKPL